MAITHGPDMFCGGCEQMSTHPVVFGAATTQVIVVVVWGSAHTPADGRPRVNRRPVRIGEVLPTIHPLNYYPDHG